MDNPMQPQQESGIAGFFKDPKNLATGLIFLAALTQKQRGQSDLNNVGRAALGATAFRGGTETALKKSRQQDEDRRTLELQRSQENEFRDRQVKIGEQGVGLQREQMSQAERLAQQRSADSRYQSPEQAALLRAQAQEANSQAGYYDRMPAAKGGDGTALNGLLHPDMLKDISKSYWDQEVAAAGLEGRTPDPNKVANSLRDFVASLQAAGPGMTVVRGPNGELLVDPGIRQPGGPTNAPTTPDPAVAIPQGGPGVDFASATPQAPPPSGRVQVTGGRRGQSFQLQEMTQLSGMPDVKLNQFLRDPRLSLEQMKAVRDEIRQRDVRKRAMNSSSPGLR